MTLAVCLAASLACGALAEDAKEPVLFFSNPSSVNLLNCWNPDGSYGLAFVATYSTYNNNGDLNVADTNLGDPYKRFNGAGVRGPARFLDFSRNAGQIQGGANGSWYEITYDLGVPIEIGKLDIYWENNSSGRYGAHYQWLGDNGQFIAGWENPTETYMTNTTTTHDVANPQFGLSSKTLTTPVTTQMLTLRVYIEAGRGDTWSPRIHGLGVFATNDQSLPIDGRYNILCQETAAGIGSHNLAGQIGGGGTFSVTNWTNRAYDVGQFKIGDSNAAPFGSCATWENFSQDYEMYGFILTMYDAKLVTNLKVEVYNGTEWVLAWGGENGKDYRWLTNDTNDPAYSVTDVAYIAFDKPVVGNGVRVSWGPISPSSYAEFRQFQVFGAAIPEPATMTLLALGGLAMLRRRK